MEKKILFILLSVLCSLPLSARRFSLSTNMLGYLNMGTLNLEASYAVARHWSVNAGAKVNPFTFRQPSSGRQMQNRQQSYSIGARLWPWHIYSGWWISGRLQYQEYNRGGIISPETEEGDGVGLALSAGYSYMLSPHFNLEFGLGFWAGAKIYTVYSCPTCGITTDAGKKGFLMPNDIMLSIAYVF